MNDTTATETTAIILAAGKSTRMKSDLPKVLHGICGRPMLAYVLDACRIAGVGRLLVVIGHGKEKVISRFEGEPDLVWIEQEEQRGTAHAVRCCREALVEFDGSVLVVAGDMPLVRRTTLAGLAEARISRGDALTMATMTLEDPTGYGRIMRDADGRLEAIIEDRDCTPAQREIREVNPSYYCFDGKLLFEALDRVEPAAGKGEYYLTDAVRILREAGHGVSVGATVAPEDAMGINSRLDLSTVGRVMQDRIQLELMNDGVTIVDPDNTWIEAGVSIGRETIIHPFTLIGTGALIGEGCRIGPFVRVGSGEVLEDGSVVEPGVGEGVMIS
jgi:bifunctional UDP-N-acetylglucosamine pyrophosphorylase/glucosamine-1-phosphate N-acetyltransferase